MTKPNTIGLGEYTDADLLAELKERGVMEEIIGENVPTESDRFDDETGACSGCDWFIEDGSDVCPCVLANDLKDAQRNRLATLIKGDRK